MKLFDKFKQGDVVFGLLEPRREVTGALTNRGYTHTFANALNDPAVSLVFNNSLLRDGKRQLDPYQYKHFRLLRKHKTYLQRKSGRTIPLMQDKPLEGAAYRRACKLLLTNRDPKRTYKAHFVTKDIDWSRVCNKTKSGLGVTDSEIRAAFRDELRHGKNPNIFFYNSDLELLPTPPWEQPENIEVFKSYRDQILK